MRKIRTGDEVIVISGRNRGQTGKVRQVMADEDRVVIEGVNIVIKHLRRGRARQAGRVEVEAPLHVSNVMLLDPETKQPTRVGIRKNADGKNERFSKKSGKSIPRPVID
ncbi:MAG: 50S ribosomal protein L24 [Chloroflexota bacterium]|jgi:large subunit ribosomal protein L24|nr:50S ribosomal protein L24 [Chloroflexota bacterium]